MAKEVQHRRGTKTESNGFTGLLSEFSVDTDNTSIRVHDGTTPGGFIPSGKHHSMTLANGANVDLVKCNIANNVYGSVLLHLLYYANKTTHMVLESALYLINFANLNSALKSSIQLIKNNPIDEGSYVITTSVFTVTAVESFITDEVKINVAIAFTEAGEEPTVEKLHFKVIDSSDSFLI